MLLVTGVLQLVSGLLLVLSYFILCGICRDCSYLQGFCCWLRVLLLVVTGLLLAVSGFALVATLGHRTKELDTERVGLTLKSGHSSGYFLHGRWALGSLSSSPLCFSQPSVSRVTKTCKTKFHQRIDGAVLEPDSRQEARGRVSSLSVSRSLKSLIARHTVHGLTSPELPDRRSVSG